MHPIAPLIQEDVIDVATWLVDEHEVFPQGARPKGSFFAPVADSSPAITPGKRYLFKRSRACYPDQFWAEIVSYRVGCALGIDVPPAFAAINSTTGESGALIEWFYDEKHELLVHGGDLLQRLQPDIDRKKGTNHNLERNTHLMRYLNFVRTLVGDWRQWWVDGFLFDALIGNTDRHQDNWGLIYWRDDANTLRCRPTPHFDNGTSLGHELFPTKVKEWSDERWHDYVARGCHRISIHEANPQFVRHGPLIAHCAATWPRTKPVARDRIQLISENVEVLFEDLLKLNCPQPLTIDRAMIYRILLTIRRRQLEILLA